MLRQAVLIYLHGRSRVDKDMNIYLLLVSPLTDYGAEYFSALQQINVYQEEISIGRYVIGLDVADWKLSTNDTFKICSFYGNQSALALSLLLENLEKAEDTKVIGIIGLITDNREPSSSSNYIHIPLAPADSSESKPRAVNYSMARVWDCIMCIKRDDYSKVTFALGVMKTHQGYVYTLDEIRSLMMLENDADILIKYCNVKNLNSIVEFLNILLQHIQDEKSEQTFKQFIRLISNNLSIEDSTNT